eukprot:scaffold6615_cov172-Amphora_coffeaeformis.AAC.5
MPGLGPSHRWPTANICNYYGALFTEDKQLELKHRLLHYTEMMMVDDDDDRCGVSTGRNNPTKHFGRHKMYTVLKLHSSKTTRIIFVLLLFVKMGIN